MRAPYTCLYRDIWDEERFWSMSDGAKLVCFYVLTTPLGNGLGCFKAGMGAMVEDSRINPKSFRESFGECISKGWFEYDEHNRVLMIPKYFERNPPINPNGITAVGKYFASIPASDLKTKCYQVVEKWAATKMESFTESFHKSFGVSLPEPPGNVSPSPSPSPSCSGTSSGSKAVKEKSNKKEKSPYSADFEDWWKQYPKKRNKPGSWKAWKANLTQLASIERMLHNLGIQCKSWDWTQDGGQYIPYPASYLNAHGWNDVLKMECAPPKSPQQTEHDRQMQIIADFAASDDDEPITVDCEVE